MSKICPKGEELNPATNRCRKSCRRDQKRNDKGRCVSKSYVPKPKPDSPSNSPKAVVPKPHSSNSPKHLKPCPPGKVRNPKTNRCKNIEDSKKKKKKSKSKSRGNIDISMYPPPPVDTVPINGPFPVCIRNSRLPLVPHQIRVVSFLNRPEQRGLLAIHDVGTGKTLTAVTASQCFLRQSPNHKVIVVTPVSLQENFKKEIRNYGANPLDIRYQFYTIQGFRNALVAKRIHQLEETFLILDEAHNIRTDQELGDGLEEDEKNVPLIGVYANALIETAKHCKKVLLLTATPLVNNPMDIVNLIAMVNGEDPVSSYREFTQMNLANYLLCKTSVYKPSEDYYKQHYPASNEIDVYIEMGKAYLARYTQMENKAEPNERAFYNGIRRMSNVIDEIVSPKIDWMMNMLRRTGPDEKFVVFSHFIKCGVNLLKTKLTEEGLPFREITGSISKEKRAEAVTLYNNNQLKVLIISKAGGEGLDLKNTTGVILMEPAWNEAANRQIIGRAVRFKSHVNLPQHKQKVDIYRLFLIKPKEKPYLNDIMTQFWVTNRVELNTKLSIDLHMRNSSLLKQVEIDQFMNFISQYSIEVQECGQRA